MSAPARRRAEVDAQTCAAADAALVRAFDLLCKRWTGVVLGTLSGGPAGFSALGRAVEGISDSVLSDRLGYALTDSGRALLPALEQIGRWAAEHLPPAGFDD